jgi:hypothetical protein
LPSTKGAWQFLVARSHQLIQFYRSWLSFRWIGKNPCADFSKIFFSIQVYEHKIM